MSNGEMTTRLVHSGFTRSMYVIGISAWNARCKEVRAPRVRTATWLLPGSARGRQAGWLAGWQAGRLAGWLAGWLAPGEVLKV